MSKIALISSQKDPALAPEIKRGLTLLGHQVVEPLITDLRLNALYQPYSEILNADGVIILLSKYMSMGDFQALEIGVALKNPGEDNKRIMLMGYENLAVPEYLAGYYRMQLRSSDPIDKQLRDLNPIILFNFQEQSRVIEPFPRYVSNNKFWILKINADTWPLDTLIHREIYYFNSRHHQGYAQNDVHSFQEIKIGDRCLTYAYNGINGFVCLFRVINVFYLPKLEDQVIQLALESIIDQPILISELDNFPFYNQLSPEVNEKLFPLPNELAEGLLALRDFADSDEDTAERDDDAASLWGFQDRTYTDVAPDDAGEEIDDQLDIADDVNALALVMAYKNVKPPLSIGLFGNWGSGKSFFMNKLKKRISELGASDDDHFCKEIVSIRFNSWHYSDANLWASLVTRIFEELETYGRKKNPGELEKLFESLHSTKELIAENDLRAKQVDAEILALKEREALIIEDIKNKVDELKGVSFLELVKVVFEDETVRAEIDAVKKDFDFVDISTIEKIGEQADELKTASGRIVETFKLAYAFSAPKMLWALFIFVAVMLGGYFAHKYIDVLKSGYADIQLFLTFVVAGGTQVLAFISPAAGTVKVLNQRLSGLKKRLDDLKEEKKQAFNAEKAKISASLEEAKAAQQQVRMQKEELTTLQEKLKIELLDIKSGKKLISFIESKVTDERYISSLGLISWIRKDFEKLDFLLKQQHESLVFNGEEQERVKNVLKVDRIVLYIDDLDRCASATVVQVLEAINLLLAFPLFVVVVGVDPRWMYNALDERFKGLLIAGDTPGDQLPERAITSRAYLEKIFQIPFQLKQLSDSGIESLVQAQFPDLRIVGSELVQADDGLRINMQVAPVQGGADSPPVVVPPPVDPVQPEPAPGPGAPVADAADKTKLLVIDPAEIAFLKSLGRLAGDSPRSLKRFVNIYRIIRTHGDIELDGRNKYEQYCAIMVLLVLLGQGANVAAFREVSEEDSLLNFEEFADAGKVIGFEQLKNALQNKEQLKFVNQLPLSYFSKNAALVSRFSFTAVDVKDNKK